MDNTKIAKQMIDFQKAAFDNTFSAMVMVQEQTEKMLDIALQQATWLPEEGTKTIREWVDTYKKGREDFKKTVDTNYKKVEDFFAGLAK